MSVQLKERSQERIALGPNTRSVELFCLDLRYYGQVRPETAQAVIDEEQTNAAEDIARVKSKYAAVPRMYFQKDHDLVDIHGNHLKEVLSDGVKWAENDAASMVPGANWELARRQAELKNLERFIESEPGTVFVEISAPPQKPTHELRQQGYCEMTHVRISAKGLTNKVLQHNLYLPHANTKFSERLQEMLGADVVYGEAQRLLENPIVLTGADNLQASIKEVENLCGAALLNTDADKSILQMIKKASGAKKEAWAFVSSEAHTDLNTELRQKIAKLSKEDPRFWGSGMEEIRTGYLKELRERYDGKIRKANAGSIIDAAAAQAVADSDVFITCGGTIEARGVKAAALASAAEVAAKLRYEVKGSGTCQACGAKGSLYGCGVMCGECNRIWCAEYAKSNGKRELSYSQVRYLRLGKLDGDFRKNDFIDDVIDELRKWNRRYDQQRQEKKQKIANKIA